MATKNQKGEKQYLQKVLAKESAISAIAESEGGTILVRALLKDVVDIVGRMCGKYGELTIQEFVGLSAEMKSKLELAEVITHAKDSEKRIRQELGNLLVEIDRDEEGIA